MSETPSIKGDSNWGNSNGIAAAAKYNPHLWSPDELRAIFVARQRELATILEALRTTSLNTTPQHLLITGQRGMGKSTLLQRVALAVEEDSELQHAWMPLRFPEEQYTVSTPAELWANVIGSLADALERQGLSTAEIDAELAWLTQLPTAQREEASLAWLQQWCISHNRRLLLLIDGTDLLFDNLAGGDSNKRGSQQDGGASALWRVRKALLHSPHLFWLGGSYQPLEAHGLYSDAFLDFFQLIELRPLTLAEMQAAIQAMARIFGAGRGLKGDAAEAEVKRMLTARPERLRAMRQLTGGNPRTTVMLYELFAAGGRDNVRTDLERLLDAMTPLYKAKLEILADQPRKVLAHVMEHWAPITAKALAQAAALPVGTVSSQLTRLEQEGLIEKTTLSGTKRLGFQASERFFNIWYLMRSAPRGARARVGWLVEFMRLWYSKDELQGLARSRWNEHRDGLHCDTSELEYSRAIARAMPADAPDRHQLDWAVFKQARKVPGFSELYELEGEDADYSTPDAYLERLEALRKQLHLTRITAENKPAWVAEVISALHLTLAEKEALAMDSENSSASKIAEIRSELSEKRELLIKNHDRESVERVEKAVEIGDFFPDCPDSMQAFTQMLDCFASHPAAFAVAIGRLVSRKSDDPVETACKKAIELAPTSARPLNSLGRLFKHTDRHAEAEVAFRKAIKLDPKWAVPWDHLGDLLSMKLDHVEEAEAAYREAITLNPEWATPWFDLGYLLRIIGRYAEAEKAYLMALEINPKWATLQRALGDLLSRVGRHQDAEVAYLKAIELNPKLAGPWGGLGDLLCKVNRYEEAEKTYRKATELNQKWAAPWHALGDLLIKVERYEEAEEAYRKAIGLNPEFANPWGDLGDLLLKFDRYEEAEEAYRKVIELNPKLARPWFALGNMLSKIFNRNLEAEAAYMKAIELNPKQPQLWNDLGDFLSDKLYRYKEAEAAYRKAVELEPGSLIAWMCLGNLLQDRLNRFNDAELAYLKAIECDQLAAMPMANLACLLVKLKRNDEASERFRQSVKLAKPDEYNLLLQAHCWLGNNDLAMQALDSLAELAMKSSGSSFHELKEQCFECHAIGLSLSLVKLMQSSRFADFLQPFSLALQAANGGKDSFLDVAAEVRGMAEEVLAQINGEH